MTALPVFDFSAFFAAFDAERRDRGLGWYEFADELWQQSAELNAQRMDHPLCGGAVSRLGARGATSSVRVVYASLARPGGGPLRPPAVFTGPPVIIDL